MTRIEDSDRSFVVTDDMQTPADVGYAESDFTWRRLASAPGPFDVVDELGTLSESAELRAAANKRLPRTFDELDELIAEKVAAAVEGASQGGNGG